LSGATLPLKNILTALDDLAGSQGSANPGSSSILELRGMTESAGAEPSEAFELKQPIDGGNRPGRPVLASGARRRRPEIRSGAPRPVLERDVPGSSGRQEVPIP